MKNVFFLSFLSRKNIKKSDKGIGEMKFDPQVGGWELLSSSYYCEESNIELFQLLWQIKKQYLDNYKEGERP